jgi:MFS superfamily sulfate permease-like transporter
MSFNPRHDTFWFLAALAFGVLALPFLVHLTGTLLFGRYASGGALGFVGDYMRGLATFSWYSWALALGPLAIVLVWRGLWRLVTR